MKYMLDANSVIHLLTDAFPKLTNRVGNTPSGDIVVSSIAFAEVALGSENLKLPEIQILDDFISEVPALPFDEAAARAYARLPFKRASFDRLIAAHAISLGLTVISRNVRDFQQVPDLAVEDWTV